MSKTEKVAPDNPSGGKTNCAACVARHILRQMGRDMTQDMIHSADYMADIRNQLGVQQAVRLIERLTGLQGRRIKDEVWKAAWDSAGWQDGNHFGVFSIGRGHVVYGGVQGRRFYLYDPQSDEHVRLSSLPEPIVIYRFMDGD